MRTDEITTAAMPSDTRAERRRRKEQADRRRSRARRAGRRRDARQAARSREPHPDPYGDLCREVTA